MWGGKGQLAQLGRGILRQSHHLISSSHPLPQDGERGVRFHPGQWADQEKVSAHEQDREEHTVSILGWERQEMGGQGGMKVQVGESTRGGC